MANSCDNKTFNRLLRKTRFDPYSDAFKAHEKQAGGLELLKALLAIHYPVPKDFKRFVLYAQLALKTGVTHWRSRMFKTSGCLIWQLNDCWPAISWSLIDYCLNPKASYFFVKRTFRPIIAPLIIKQGTAQVYLINDADKALEATLRFQIIEFKGKIVCSRQIDTLTPAYTSKFVQEITLDTIALENNHVYVISLEKDGTLLFEDAKTVKNPKDLQLPTPNIKIVFKKVDFLPF